MLYNINENDLDAVLTNNEKLIFVIGKGENCGVCHAVSDRIKITLLKKYPQLDVYNIMVNDNPLFRGKYLIFTFPTILVFDNNKEIHRESRIVDFRNLERLLSLYYE